MERITKKDRYGHFYTNKANCRNIHSLDGERLEGMFFENQVLAIDGEAIDKLGQLEDIEEEIGIELITLFKAYSNGFYVKGEKEKQYIDFQNYLNANAFKNKEMFYGHERCYQYVKLYDYGKEWALTKQELEQ